MSRRQQQKEREGGKGVEGGRTRGKWEDESREIARFLLGEGVRF
jgi:hypothetical protein